MITPEYVLEMYRSLYADNVVKGLFQLNRTERPGRPYSVISHGTLEEQGQGQGKLKPVVMKTYRKINETTVEKVAQRTYQEVKLLAALHGLCPNINMFYGVHFVDSALLPEALPMIPSIIVEYVKYDSFEYTQGKDFGVRLDIVQQLGNGLLYMHSLGLVHGDMKPDNFRVSEDGTVKIIDFGLGRHEAEQHTGLPTVIDPCYRFIAPELIDPDMDDVSMDVTKATDIYAFSMTALQVLDGREYMESRPFNQHGQPYAVRSAINRQEWPQAQHYSNDISPEAWSVISACWTTGPAGRPTIDGLLKSLAGIASSA